MAPGSTTEIRFAWNHADGGVIAVTDHRGAKRDTLLAFYSVND